MSINSIYNSTMRFSGMASGIDTDTIIRNLMRVEQLKVDRLTQSKTRIEWQRDEYRSVYRQLKDFKDTRFNILNTSTNMLLSNAYRPYKVTSSNSNLVAASSDGQTVISSNSIDSIDSLASKAYLKSTNPISEPLEGTVDLTTGAALNGKGFTVTLDGITKTIQFSKDYSDINILKNDLQTHLNNAFGNGRIMVEEHSSVDGSFIRLSADNSVLRLSGDEGSALEDLGFISGQGNRIGLDAPIDSIGLKTPLTLSGEGTLSFDINSVSFTFEGTATLRQIMSEVNNSEAGVTLSYSTVTDGFTITSDQTGAGQMINIVNNDGNLFGEGSAIGITELVGDNGINAQLSVNGQVISRNTNTFTLDGIQYTLKGVFSEAEGPVEITAEQDIGAAVNRIKGFVSQYNELIDEIHNKLSEESFRDFQPLTDEQKRELSEREVEIWEEKARSGLLRGDRILGGIVRDMRRALFDSVEATGIDPASIGITTGSYFEKGKLRLDETKLTEALQNNGEQVERLFASQSEIRYSPNLTAAEREQRYNESGLMFRISDILEDNIRTSRNSSGQKGLLLERAGIVGDTSESRNMLYEEMQRINRRIDSAMRTLQMKEQSYWRQFTAMEKAISQMNSQSAWLTQQMGMY